MVEHSRRRFLSQLGIAGAAGLGGLGIAGFGGGARSFAAEPPPEITTITLEKSLNLPCAAVRGRRTASGRGVCRHSLPDQRCGTSPEVAHNQIDWRHGFAADTIADVDKGAPLTMVAGIHLGCYELIAHDHVRSIAGLKGRTVGWSPGYASSRHLVALMAKFVGLDPDKDIHWVDDPNIDPMALFLDRKIDAFLAAPPQTQELRARGIGHSLVNSATDRPWSQYFCCMLVGRTEFVQKYPVATKRIVRAFLKATDLCANEPERVARLMVDQGFTRSLRLCLADAAGVALRRLARLRSRGSVRFFALRLNEAGFIKSDPQRIIAEHTNWRFLNEVKRELKT